MNTNTGRTLILATSYAPEQRWPEMRLAEFPRTDYVELSKTMPCDILDYAIYDHPGLHTTFRRFERKLRLDFHLALLGYRRARDYQAVLLMSERVAIPFAMISRAFGTRSETVFMSMHSSNKQASLFRRLRLAKEITRTVSFTPGQTVFLTDSMGIVPDSISYIPYAVDEQFFHSQLSSEGVNVMTAGGVPGRDYDTLIQALDGLDIPVVIVSGGRSYGRKTDGIFRQLPSNFRRLVGLSSAEMRSSYEAARVVVVPLKRDRADGAGTSVLLESMSMARTTIVSGSSGISHYVENGITGSLVDPEDPCVLRNEVLALYNDTARCAVVGKGARSAIEANFGLQHYVERLRNVIAGERLSWPMTKCTGLIQ